MRLIDYRYRQLGRVDKIFGAAQYQSLILDGVFKFDHLVTQEAIFGWILLMNQHPKANTKSNCALLLHVRMCFRPVLSLGKVFRICAFREYMQT